MNNPKIPMAVIVLIFIFHSESSPLAQLQKNQDELDSQPNRSEVNAFMIATHVTREEVEEYQHLNDFIISSSENHSFNDEEIQQGQGRSFGNIFPELTSSNAVASLAVGVGAAYKFWKVKSAFDQFRLWIEERRRLSTTVKSLVVHIVGNPDKIHYR